MRITKLIALLLIFAIPASAKPKHWYTDWRFWAGNAIIAGGLALDGVSTSHVRNICLGCAETNPLLGKRPSDRTIALFELSGFAFYTGLNSVSNWQARKWDKGNVFGDRKDAWFWRNFGTWSIPGVSSMMYIHGIKNYQIKSDCPPPAGIPDYRAHMIACWQAGLPH